MLAELCEGVGYSEASRVRKVRALLAAGRGGGLGAVVLAP